MKRPVVVFLILALALGCVPMHAQQSNDGADNAPAASTSSPERVERAMQSLGIAFEAAEASKPRKANRTLTRLLGLAALVIVAAGADSSSAPPWPMQVNAALYGTESLVSGGDTREVMREKARYRALRDLTDVRIYGLVLTGLDALAQVDGNAAMSAASGVKDPYWKARAMTRVSLSRIGRGDVDAGLGMLKQAVDSAASGSYASRAAVASDAYSMVPAIWRSNPEAAIRIADECFRLFPIKAEKKDERAMGDASDAQADAIAFFAVTDPRKAEALLRAVKDETDRRTTVRMAALRMSAQQMPAVLEKPTSALSAIWRDKAASGKAQELIYGLAGLHSAPKPLGMELMDDAIADRDMLSVAEIVIAAAEADPDGARAAFDASLAGSIGIAADRAYDALLDRAKPTYEMLEDERTWTMRSPHNPIWEDYESRISQLLSAWHATVRALAKIDPALAQSAVSAAKSPAVAACGTFALIGPSTSESERNCLIDSAMAEWARVPSARKGSRFLGVGQQNDDRKEFIRGAIGRTLALQVADIEAPAAAEILRGTRYEYEVLRQLAQTLAAKDAARALSLLDACPDAMTRAAAERYLASVAARTDPDKAVRMFRSAQAQAEKAFAGSHKAHKGVVPKDRKFDETEKDLDTDAAAEDLSLLVNALSSTDPAKAEEFIDSLPDPYQRCQALRILSLQAQAGSDGSRILAEAINLTPSVADTEYRSQLSGDLAVTLSRFDAAKAASIAEKIEGEAHKAWALALIAARISASDPARSAELLVSAQQQLPRIKDPKQRAYVSCVVTRAWLGSDTGTLLSDADAPTCEGRPW